jgi:predicted DNA-binding transcriptional regulator AlpA
MSARLSDITRRADLLGELEDLGRSIPREELPKFLGEIERVRVSILVSLSSAAVPIPVPASEERTTNRLLSVAETAARLGRSKSWVYKNRAALPIVRFHTGGYGFSAQHLERWIGRRAARA